MLVYFKMHMPKVMTLFNMKDHLMTFSMGLDWRWMDWMKLTGYLELTLKNSGSKCKGFFELSDF